MSKIQLAKHKSCVLCNQEVPKPQVQPNQAIKEQKLEDTRIELYEHKEDMLIQTQLTLCEIEEEKLIEQEAQKILAQNKVCIEADYMKYAEELHAYSAQ